MMNPPHPVFVLVVVALVGTVGLEYGAGSVAVVTPTEPHSPANSPDSDDRTREPSPTVESAVVGASSPPDHTESAVRMRVGRVAACGPTCRDVTARLHNDGAVDLTNVQVYTTISAGDEIVWVDADRVGTVAAGDSYTTTKRIQVGHGEILTIHSNDGFVTVETVVEADQGSTVVTEDVDVV